MYKDYSKIIKEFVSNYQGTSYSQLGQDLVVMALTDAKHRGYFVEFGAMDGRYFSNTWLLESELEWNGIVAEAAKCFHAALKENRKCAVDFRAISAVTGDLLEFKETYTELGLSGLTEYFEPGEMHTNRRHQSDGNTYQVSTLSLQDLLEYHNAPREIDYMSIDTEGSEYAILSNFDFSKYDIKIFTIEHNYLEPRRTEIRALMTMKGYDLIDPSISSQDDWFVIKS